MHEEHEEAAPPYEESECTPILSEKAAQRSSSSLNAHERLAEIRQQRVRLLVDGHVGPLLESAILLGKQSQTIIVVPSDAIATSAVLTASNLVHRPKSTSTNLIQLQGLNSTGAFWTQLRVVQDLEKTIRSTLQYMTGASQPTASLPVRPADLSSPTTGQKSWMKRTFGMPGPDHDPTGSTGQWRLGWRADDRESPLELAHNEFALSAKVRDVSFRTETELGLLTTTTGPCIMIEVECGS